MPIGSKKPVVNFDEIPIGGNKKTIPFDEMKIGNLDPFKNVNPFGNANPFNNVDPFGAPQEEEIDLSKISLDNKLVHRKWKVKLAGFKQLKEKFEKAESNEIFHKYAD